MLTTGLTYRNTSSIHHSIMIIIIVIINIIYHIPWFCYGIVKMQPYSHDNAVPDVVLRVKLVISHYMSEKKTNRYKSDESPKHIFTSNYITWNGASWYFKYISTVVTSMTSSFPNLVIQLWSVLEEGFTLARDAAALQIRPHVRFSSTHICHFLFWTASHMEGSSNLVRVPGRL